MKQSCREKSMTDDFQGKGIMAYTTIMLLLGVARGLHILKSLS